MTLPLLDVGDAPGLHGPAATAARLGETLDGVGVALCLFDERHRTVLWNATFLLFFPEHAGHVHAGESYRDNLYRFYGCRLTGEEAKDVDRLVEAGVARHASQSRPFEFEHRGRLLRAASRPMPGGGRVRVWTSLPQDAQGEQPAMERDLFANLADGAVITGAGGRIVAVNEEFRVLYALGSRAEAVGETLVEIVSRAWRAALGTAAAPKEVMAPFTDDARFAGAAFEIELPGGLWRRVIERRMADGTSYQSHADITVLKEQQSALHGAERLAREGEERFRVLTDNSGDIIVSLGPGGRMEFVSPAITRVLGWIPAELTGRPIGVLLHAADEAAVRASVEGAQGVGTSGPVLTCRLRRAEGPWVWMEAHMRAVRGAMVREEQTICSFRDITRRVEAEGALRDAHAALARLVVTDALTGIANRRRFEEVLTQYGPGCTDRVPLSLLLIDIDHFKRVNDLFGHQAGDACLQVVAQTIERLVLPDGGVAARFGGEEFAVVLPGLTVEAAGELAGRIRMAVEMERSQVFSREQAITVSIGVVATVAGDPERSGMDSMVSEADAALYRAKRAGRNRVALAGEG